MGFISKLHGKCYVILIDLNPLIADVLKKYLKGYHLVDFSTQFKLQPPIRDDLTVCIVDQDATAPVPYGGTRVAHARFPNAGILVLGRKFSGAQAFSLLLEGVRGILTYDQVPYDLSRAVEMVANSGLWCCPDMLQQACLHMQNVWRSKSNGCFRFTPRQKEIIDLVGKRLTNKEIAYHLSISENTVKFHLSKVFRKLGANRRESVTEVLRQVS